MPLPRGATSRRLVALVVGAGVVVATLAGPADARPASPERGSRPVQAVPESTGSGLREDYEEVTAKEAALLDDLEAARASQARLKLELADLETRVADTKADLAAAEVTLDAAEARATSLAGARVRADAEVAEAREQLRKQIVASYVSGNQSDLALIAAVLDADTSEDVGNTLIYSKVVLGDSDAAVRDLIDAQDAARQADIAAKAARNQARSRRADQDAAARSASAARNDKQRLVAEVDDQVAAEKEALDAIKARKSFIESQIALLERTSDSITDLLGTTQAGEDQSGIGEILITNPIPGYQVGSTFGPRTHPILGTVRLHAGADLGAPAGTVIYAPADGVVISAGVRGGYGNATIIDHGSSLATLYGHQSRIDVKAGQIVTRGQPIGLVGSTGLSTGPHLHFETRVAGVPVDPETIVDFSRPAASYEAEAKELADLLAEYERTVDATN